MIARLRGTRIDLAMMTLLMLVTPPLATAADYELKMADAVELITSKWNEIAHRLFSFISRNWHGEPLVRYATIVRLIAATTTTTGLRVTCTLDTRQYRLGRRITDVQMAQVQLTRATFHGDWNYTISPKRNQC